MATCVYPPPGMTRMTALVERFFGRKRYMRGWSAGVVPRASGTPLGHRKSAWGGFASACAWSGAMGSTRASRRENLNALRVIDHIIGGGDGHVGFAPQKKGGAGEDHDDANGLMDNKLAGGGGAIQVNEEGRDASEEKPDAGKFAVMLAAREPYKQQPEDDEKGDGLIELHR